MEAPSVLLEQWTRQVKELFPHLHGHQQKGLAFAVLGIALTGEAVLQRLAACRRERSRGLASAHVIDGTRMEERTERDQRQNSVGDDASSGLEACYRSRVRPRIGDGSV